MANTATAAGNNGVSGAVDGISGGSVALRRSVSQTEGGTYSASDVKSHTKNLRFAYNGVECDSPAVSRS